MAKSKFSENLIKMKCGTCNGVGYFTRKNKKLVERKIKLRKYSKALRKHVMFEESKK